jgi:endonuclease/exonuclease/phosphatase family metal-dependent hydrolase
MNAPRNIEPSVPAGEGGSGTSIGLATWNVRGFARPDINDLAEVLQAGPQTIVVVQELQRSQAKRLAGLLGMEHHWSFKHSPLGPLLTKFAEGLATFSTEPLSRTESLDLTPHVRSISYRRRIAQFTYLDQWQTDVVNIHLASHDDSSARLEQLRMVLDRIHARGATRCIVAGDFNAAREPSLYALLENAGFVDAWISQTPTAGEPQTPKTTFGLGLHDPQTTSTGDGFTNPAGSTRSRLDRIFLRGFTVQSASIPVDNESWSKRSDHLPVFATVTQASDANPRALESA